MAFTSVFLALMTLSRALGRSTHYIVELASHQKYLTGTMCLQPPLTVNKGRTVCTEGFCTWTVNVSASWLLTIQSLLKTNECDHNSTLQVDFSIPDISLGIAFPQTNSGLNEIIVNATVPLPYGFLSVTLGPSP